MRNLLFSAAFLCFAGLFTGCSSSIKTVVDQNALKQPYKSSLILYDPGVKGTISGTIYRSNVGMNLLPSKFNCQFDLAIPLVQ